MFRQIAVIAISIWSIIFSSNALARDFANRAIIGFSSDGKYFAFEQYGSQDGSGFPYSELFVIDTETDEWALGSPFRVLLKEDAEELSLIEGIEMARAKNRRAANTALQTISEPGIIAASNRVDAKVENPQKITIEPQSFWLPDNQKSMVFQVTELELDAPAKCLDYALGERFVGFSLTRSGKDGASVEMHRDNSIPASRACPLAYEPSDVVVHFTQEGKFTIAVLMRMSQIGFEGADRRFIAVTGSLN